MTAPAWPPEKLDALLAVLRVIPSLAEAEITLAREAYDALAARPEVSIKRTIWRREEHEISDGVDIATLRLGEVVVRASRGLVGLGAEDEALLTGREIAGREIRRAP